MSNSSSTAQKTTYYYSLFKKPDSQHTIKRYYKFITDEYGNRHKSIWITKDEAEKNGAIERGQLREMKSSHQQERLSSQQYVGYIQEQVKTRSKSGRLRTMTRAVGKDGKLYKANENEANESGLPIEPKHIGLQLWYISSGRKHPDQHIKKLQKEFHKLHKLHTKQRKAGLLSYDLNTYTLGNRNKTINEKQINTKGPKIRGSISDVESDMESENDIEQHEDYYSNRNLDLILKSKSKSKFQASESESEFPITRKQNQRVVIKRRHDSKNSKTKQKHEQRYRYDLPTIISESSEESEKITESDTDTDIDIFLKN